MSCDTNNEDLVENVEQPIETPDEPVKQPNNPIEAPKKPRTQKQKEAWERCLAARAKQREEKKELKKSLPPRPKDDISEEERK